jgi:hypothetical protein
MTISATILAHSKSPAGKQLVTFELVYPRMPIHEALLMHRALSRNVQGDGAVPVSALISQVRADPAMPGDLTPSSARVWLAARDEAVKKAGELMKQQTQPHKQTIKLLLRPWEHVTAVVSGTEWKNFFALRLHGELVDKMWDAMQASTPRELKPGEWHLPYIYQHELDAAAGKPEEIMGNLIKVSVARCARTSFKNHRNKMATFAEDVELYNRVSSRVPHASPMEHQATPDTFRIVAAGGKVKRVWDHPELHGNFVGWCQHRKTCEL